MNGDVFKILNELSSTSKRNEKITILESNKDNPVLKLSFELAYNPYINFWIKKIPLYTQNHVSTDHYTLNTALYDLLNLSNRVFTGNAGIEYLRDTLSNLYFEDAAVVELIIKKDLNCGVAVSTINKIWPKLIPEFDDVMKCHDSIEHIVYPAYAQVKCDGSRCILECIDEEGEYIAYSSGGNPIDLGGLFRNYVRRYMKPGEKFDGELVVYNVNDNVPLDRKTSNGIINKIIKGTQLSEQVQSTIAFIVWDIVDPTSQKHYSIRFQELEYRLLGNGSGFEPSDFTFNRFQLVETETVNSQEEAFEFYERQIARGLEGAIIKNYEGVWKSKRVKYQGKMKSELECEVMITGWEPHIKYPEKLGSFILTAYSDDKTQEMIFNVGSGISKDMRETDPEEFMGKVATIRFNQLVTNKKDPEKFTLYIPRVIEIRHDKHEGDSIEQILSICNSKEKVKGKLF